MDALQQQATREQTQGVGQVWAGQCRCGVSQGMGGVWAGQAYVCLEHDQTVRAEASELADVQNRPPVHRARCDRAALQQ
eukprot:353366-Chlamydomonas_euryale.AAC.3